MKKNIKRVNKWQDKNCKKTKKIYSNKFKIASIKLQKQKKNRQDKKYKRKYAIMMLETKKRRNKF